MDAGSLHTTATDDPLFISSSILLIQPGMGLPFELWDHIISFLEPEPYPLLACCLTCRSFNKHARLRLQQHSYPRLHVDDYTAIDRFVDEIHTIPGRAQAIRWIFLTGHNSPSVALPLVPYRLASQLKNIDTIQFEDLFKVPNVPSSLWSLYGHAFPSVTSLHLIHVRFPSFVDFIRLITSFHSLRTSRLDSVSCARVGISPRTLRSPYKPRPLRSLRLGHMNDDGGLFFRSFVSWFSLGDSRGIEWLQIDVAVLSYPSGILLLQNLHMHLKALGLNCDSLAEYRSMKDFHIAWRKVLGE